MLAGMLLIIGLWALDMMAWKFAKASGQYFVMAGTALAMTVAVLRAVLPKIVDLPRSLPPEMRRNLILLVIAVGVVALFMALIFWVSVVHRSVTMALFNRQLLEFKQA